MDFVYTRVGLLALVSVLGAYGLPEQGVASLSLFNDSLSGDRIYAGIGKSMYRDSLLSLDIKCRPGAIVSLAWGIRSVVCANEFITADEDFKSLQFEWKSIDNVITLSKADQTREVNNHMYFTFPEQTYTCLQNGTIILENWYDKIFKQLTLKTPTTKDTVTEATSGSGNSESDTNDSESDKGDGANDSPVIPSTLVPSTMLSTTLKANKKVKRAADTKPKVSEPVQSSLSSTTVMSTTDVTESVDALVKVPSDNIYIFIVAMRLDKSTANLSLTVRTYGDYGYLSVIDWPLLPFYAVMCAVYTVFLVVWWTLCCCYCKDILRVQYWIGLVIFIGFVEQSAFLGEYHTVNQTGQSVPGAVIFGELVSAGKRTLSRALVIIVSVGYGIVKPRLGPTGTKVAVVGVAYFIVSSVDGVMRATSHKAIEQTTSNTIILLILAVTDALICWWIFTALVGTMRTLRLRRNLVKLSLYRHFTNTLIFSVVASLIFLVWSIVEHKHVECLTDWRELWVDDAFWHLLFSIILLVIMILWRPSANNQRYAYSALVDGPDEADEPMMSEAYEGMKMRGAKTPTDTSHRHGDSTEDDLRWIEDNIPSSVADGALPSLLDSEEEIMTTKYELSKMQ